MSQMRLQRKTIMTDPDKPSIHDSPQGGCRLVSLMTAWFILFAIATGLIIGKIIMELITR